MIFSLSLVLVRFAIFLLYERHFVTLHTYVVVSSAWVSVSSCFHYVVQAAVAAFGTFRHLLNVPTSGTLLRCIRTYVVVSSSSVSVRSCF